MINILADVSPAVAAHKTGIGHLMDSVLTVLDQRPDVHVRYFAFVARGYLPTLSHTYPGLIAPHIPAKLSKPAIYLGQKVGVPIELFAKNIDVVLSFDAICLPLRSGITAAYIADITPITNPEWHEKTTIFWFKQRLKAIAKYADLVFTISNETKADIISYLPLHPDRIVVTYPGIPANFASKTSLSHTALKAYKLPHDFVVLLGTQEPRKNAARVIKAIKQVRRNHPNLQLVMIGHAGWGKKTKLPKWVTTTGYVPDEVVGPIIKKSTALLYPSLKEGFGFPVLQGFHQKVPVITSNISSMTEISGGAAIEVNPLSVESIAGGISKAVTLTANQKQTLLKHQQQRLKQFSFEDTVDKIISAINKGKNP